MNDRRLAMRIKLLFAVKSFLKYYLFIFILFLISCKVKEKPPKKLILEEKTPQYLLQKTIENNFICNTLQTKASAIVKINKEITTFNANIRLKEDSAIWISISPLLGIEVARMLILKDSLKLVDRVNSKYAVTNFDYINNLLESTLNFDMLQSLLLGNYFSYLDERKLKVSYVDGSLYLISTIGKRKLKSLDEEKEPKRVKQDIWLSPETYRVSKMIIQDNKTNKRLEATYDNFKNVDNSNILFAHNSKVHIQSKDPIQITLEYSKVVINKPQDFPFSIPNKYQKLF